MVKMTNSTYKPNNIQLASWNVNSLNVRLEQVLDWLQENPAVAALGIQETKLSDNKFPLEAFSRAGWHATFLGQKTYNGVALISKQPLTDVVYNNPLLASDGQARLITATLSICANTSVRILNGYFPNGQRPESEKFVYKMQWLDALEAWLRKNLNTYEKLVLMGDFNIAPEDADSHDPKNLRETIHHTTQERDHFKKLLAYGMVDAFRLFQQPEKSFSWWDYREISFRRNRGLRIDHILISEALKDAVQACLIDKEPRKKKRPSDHTPVVIALDL